MELTEGPCTFDTLMLPDRDVFWVDWAETTEQTQIILLGLYADPFCPRDRVESPRKSWRK